MEQEDKLLTLQQVVERTSLSKSEIYRLLPVGLFPQPVRIRKKVVRWSNNEISAWIAEHIYNR